MKRIKNGKDEHKDFVFSNEEELEELFPKNLQGGSNGDQFIRLINNFLNPYSSFSFKISKFSTSLCDHLVEKN